MENLQSQIFIFKFLKLNKKSGFNWNLGVKTNNSFHKLSNTTMDAINLSKILRKLKKKKSKM